MTSQRRDDRDAPGFSLSRRRLLQGACAAVGSAAVGMFGFERFARADLPLPSGRAFIFCYFPGGWDQLLFLDPRDPTAPGFADENRATNLFETRYGELDGVNGFAGRILRPADPSSPLTFGPAAAKTADAVKITDFASRIAIVRGMNMSTLGHEVGYRYFLTGKFPAGAAARGSSVATEIVAQMAPRRPIPNLALRTETYNDRHPGSASALRVDNINDLLLVLQPSAFQERDVVERALAQYGQAVAPCDVEALNRRGLLSQMRASRDQGDTIVRENLAGRFRFVSDAATDAMGQPTEAARIRALYGFAQGDVNAPGARAAMAAQAVKLGVSQVVSITIGNGTDTHFTGNPGHAGALYPRREGLHHPAPGPRVDPAPRGRVVPRPHHPAGLLGVLAHAPLQQLRRARPPPHGLVHPRRRGHSRQPGLRRVERRRPRRPALGLREQPPLGVGRGHQARSHRRDPHGLGRPRPVDHPGEPHPAAHRDVTRG